MSNKIRFKLLDFKVLRGKERGWFFQDIQKIINGGKKIKK